MNQNSSDRSSQQPPQDEPAPPVALSTLTDERIDAIQREYMAGLQCDPRRFARMIEQAVIAASAPAQQAKPSQPVAAEVEKDAQRYRWLREQDWYDGPCCVVRYPKKAIRLGFDCPSRNRLDEAIDAFLAGTGSDESAKENGNG